MDGTISLDDPSPSSPKQRGELRGYVCSRLSGLILTPELGHLSLRTTVKGRGARLHSPLVAAQDFWGFFREEGPGPRSRLNHHSWPHCSGEGGQSRHKGECGYGLHPGIWGQALSCQPQERPSTT